jgi:transcriptional regulator with XRE-family HTH domain
MAGSARLVEGVKARLRAQGLTYRDLARRLGVSEPTVKRDLARGNFTLERLDRICQALGIGIEELLAVPDRAPLTELTEQQEVALVTNPRLLLVTYLVVNDWKFADITATFRLDSNELIDVLLKLDKLKVVDFRPPMRFRKLTARNFTWRKDGPVQAFFLQRVIPEFFSARFDELGDEMRFVSGTLSAASMLRLQASLRRVAAEFDELAHQDARVPLEERDGCSALLAFRQWEFSEFAKLRRTPKPRRRSSTS